MNCFKFRTKNILAMAGFIFVLSQRIVFAELGISTRFSDAILENLQIGESYNVSQLKGLPLTIINGSSMENEIQVEVVAPKAGELKEGYEAIPDISWVKVLPDRFKLPAGGRNLSDIVISIPNDPGLVGRHFQVMFWAHTARNAFLNVGVRIRIRFSVGAGSPESLLEEAKRKRMLDLNFRLDPVILSLKTLPLGKKVNIKKEQGQSIKLVNTGSSALKLKVESGKYVKPQSPPEGYVEIPDPKWISIKPATLKSAPDSIVPLQIELKVPDEPQYKGKKYAGLINVTLVEEEVPVNIYSQILFETEK